MEIIRPINYVMLRRDRFAGGIAVRVHTMIDDVLRANSRLRKLYSEVIQSGDHDREIKGHEIDLEDENSIWKLLHEFRRVTGVYTRKVIGLHRSEERRVGKECRS